MSGTEGGHWQNWGSPVTSTLLQLAGAGLTANRGALGPPLMLLGDILSGARQSGVESASGRRFESIMAPRERAVEIPGTGQPAAGDVEGSSPAVPPTRRTYSSEPTSAEALRTLSEMQGVSDPVRNALLKMIRTTRFRDDDRPPFEIERERTLAQRDVERGQLAGASERLMTAEGVPENVRQEARGVIAAGGHPNVTLPPQITPEERTFRAEVEEGKHGDPKTAEGLAGIVDAAHARGFDKLANAYGTRRGFLKETREEGRVTQVRDALLPKWRQQAEGLRAQGVSETSLAGVNVAIAAAEADPSPKNVGAVTTAIANVGRMEQGRKQFDARLAAYKKRTDAAMKGKTPAMANALLREITSEIAKNTTMANTDPDPVTRAHAAERVMILQEQQGQLRDFLYSQAFGGGAPEGEGPTPGPTGSSAPAQLRYRLTPSGDLVPVGR